MNELGNECSGDATENNVISRDNKLVVLSLLPK